MLYRSMSLSDGLGPRLEVNIDRIDGQVLKGVNVGLNFELLFDFLVKMVGFQFPFRKHDDIVRVVGLSFVFKELAARLFTTLNLIKREATAFRKQDEHVTGALFESLSNFRQFSYVVSGDFAAAVFAFGDHEFKRLFRMAETGCEHDEIRFAILNACGIGLKLDSRCIGL